MQYWEEFTLRFSKYASFLYVSRWDKQVHEIEKSIEVVSMDLKQAKFSDCFHTLSSETLQSLQEIIASIETMASQIDRKHMKPTLLIVDDNQAFIDSVIFALTEFLVLKAHSPAEARERIHAPIDLVLLDLVFDEKSPEKQEGLEFILNLRHFFRIFLLLF
jgi:PleD family two-component response regulator